MSSFKKRPDYTNSLGMKFIRIPAGEFMMGSPPEDKDASADEKPQHKVRIAKAFYLGMYEVTQEQWITVMGDYPIKDYPGYLRGIVNAPVACVSWNQAQEFIRLLNQKEGTKKYRLPTEAEWEYAARAGTQTIYYFGDDPGHFGLAHYAWYQGNTSFKTSDLHSVGQKQPNPWGLYDMYGNVSEWAQDWYDDGYYSKSPVVNPRGISASQSGNWEQWSSRVVRGCDVGHNYEAACRSAYRMNSEQDRYSSRLGFRLAVSLEEPITDVESHTNSIGMDFVLVPGGRFLMGDNGLKNARPRHRVILSQSFYLGKYEVTQAQWEAVMGSNPSNFKGRSNPVEQVSWEDAQKFIRRLNQMEGTDKYRLPTEAEWERAADPRVLPSQSERISGRNMWAENNSAKTTHPVGQLAPNIWGLYDMLGNVWEWTQDRYDPDYYAESHAIDPSGPSSGSLRVMRGYAWDTESFVALCGPAFRYAESPDFRLRNLGFRLAYSYSDSQ
ncbi:MAG: formylglycine-generating enzyme family protein [Deltaproteobacteria bacterium]|nr:formylglycine-generating enzyme family protein [Deltaproteobacteria bacterium]